MKRKLKKLNEKILLYIAGSCLLVSCNTTRIYNHSGTNAEVRNDLAELQNEQSESGIIAERIDGRNQQLEVVIEERKRIDDELERLIEEIRGNHRPE